MDKLDVTDAVDADASLAIPILTAYIAAHPNLKAIGTQHGNVTAVLEKVLQAAGKKPGDIITGGIDLAPATLQGIKDGYLSVSFDQVLYLQGYYPIQQIWLTKNYLIPGLSYKHRRRHSYPAEHCNNRSSDPRRHSIIP